MAKWVDVRVARESRSDAMAAIMEEFAPVTLSVEEEPPAAGQVEFQVRAVSEARMKRVLLLAGVRVLAIRTQIRDDPAWVRGHASAG